eukprot:tig00020723_g13428.t1
MPDLQELVDVLREIGRRQNAEAQAHVGELRGLQAEVGALRKGNAALAARVAELDAAGQKSAAESSRALESANSKNASLAADLERLRLLVEGRDRALRSAREARTAESSRLEAALEAARREAGEERARADVATAALRTAEEALAGGRREHEVSQAQGQLREAAERAAREESERLRGEKGALERNLEAMQEQLSRLATELQLARSPSHDRDVAMAEARPASQEEREEAASREGLLEFLERERALRGRAEAELAEARAECARLQAAIELEAARSGVLAPFRPAPDGTGSRSPRPAAAPSGSESEGAPPAPSFELVSPAEPRRPAAGRQAGRGPVRRPAPSGPSRDKEQKRRASGFGSSAGERESSAPPGSIFDDEF